MVLPLFPLGPVAYAPGSTQVLQIFEPRYRQMVSDVLLSGGRRFVTTMTNPEDNRELAQVGVVFYLEDLKEVSEQTKDQVKYICTHKVLDKRVTIHKVLNPADAVTAETYLKCEVSEITEEEQESDTSKEVELKKALENVAEAQELGEEDVRFSKEAVDKVLFSKGVGDGTLWAAVDLWKQFLDARVQATYRKLSAEMQARLLTCLTDLGEKEKAKGQKQDVSFEDLPADLQRDVANYRERLMDETAPLAEEQTIGIQRLLQTTSHDDRLQLFHNMVTKEQNRLVARRTLRAVFGEGKSDTTTKKEEEED